MDAGNGGKPGRSSGVCRNCLIYQASVLCA